MRSTSRFILAASLIPFFAGPALAHPGHGAENPFLHEFLHFGNGENGWVAIGVGVVALLLAAAAYRRTRRAY